jgi:hypothetical protein
MKKLWNGIIIAVSIFMIFAGLLTAIEGGLENLAKGVIYIALVILGLYLKYWKKSSDNK